MFRYTHSMPNFLRVLSWNVLNIVKFFLDLSRGSYTFSPSFCNALYHIYWFTYAESSLHPTDEFHLIIVMIFVMWCWIQSSSICWEIYIYIHQGYWPVVFFLVVSLPGFGIRETWPHKTHFGELLPLQIFGRVLEELVLPLFKMSGRIHQ